MLIKGGVNHPSAWHEDSRTVGLGGRECAKEALGWAVRQEIANRFIVAW